MGGVEEGPVGFVFACSEVRGLSGPGEDCGCCALKVFGDWVLLS